ncbi:glycoside hydrolase [Ophiobolus disseminans]|uniref:Glycoside hydrolase n=1 Tax=Ophiobolus disseminans TaxID=1469910 RepID=A0A6A6ZVR2_9PLEO|nr:glycoside hydrolase [Ophiobolus disseminans]
MLSLILTLLSTIPSVSTHGRITNITTSSDAIYSGWDPASPTPSPPLAAWNASNLGNIFIPPSRFNTSDIICHFDATPGALHINVAAGDTLKLQWNEWPTSHVGPVLSYLAQRTGAPKEKLKWVKIDELGWLNDTGWDDLMLGGTWASNVLIANDFQWTVRIPKGLAKGDYVLRHEIIALHVADELDGAQAYPQCVNVRVVKGGTKRVVGGVLGTQLYGVEDRGILVDVHGHIEGYEIPGPKVWSGAEGVRQPNQ